MRRAIPRASEKAGTLAGTGKGRCESRAFCLAAALSAAMALLPILRPERTFAAEIVKGPYVQNPTGGGVTLVFETDVPAPASVLYGETPPPAVETSLPENTFHEARIEGLAPGKKYYYLLKVQGAEPAKGTFSTAKGRNEAARFVAYGDFREGIYEREIVRLILKQKGVDFVLATGDYMNDGGEPKLWEGFFRTAGPLMARLPYFPVLGNHEKDSPLYFHYFSLPGNERYYTFDSGPARFFMLDSNAGHLDSPEQLAWLEGALKEASDDPSIRFKVAAFHHPAYSSTKDGDGEAVKRLWVPLLEKYKVDVVFNGHRHNYERSLVNGVHHVVTGGGGASLYDFKSDPAPHSVAREKTHHIVVADVEAHALVVRAVDLKGKEFDRFTVEKP